MHLKFNRQERGGVNFQDFFKVEVDSIFDTKKYGDLYLPTTSHLNVHHTTHSFILVYSFFPLTCTHVPFRIDGSLRIDTRVLNIFHVYSYFHSNVFKQPFISPYLN